MYKLHIYNVLTEGMLFYPLLMFLVPSLLGEAIPETLNNIDQSLTVVRQSAYKYTGKLKVDQSSG